MFLRRLARSTSVIGWLVAAFLVTSNPDALAAQTIYYSALGTQGCATNYNSTYLQAQKIIATQSVTANTLRVLVGNQITTNFASSRYYIMGHNAVPSPAGAPSTTVVATFTPDAINGSGLNTIATYVGTFTSVAGTTYWIVTGQTANLSPLCYSTSVTATDLNLSAFKVDTSTSGSNTYWIRANSASGTTPTNATWSTYGATQLAWLVSLENNTTEAVAVTVNSQSGLSTAEFRRTSNLQATVNTDSKVTFYANDKVIAGCRNLLSTSGSATCAWKPSLHGSYRVFVRAVPVSTSYTTGTSSYLNIGVGARTNKR